MILTLRGRLSELKGVGNLTDSRYETTPRYPSLDQSPLPDLTHHPILISQKGPLQQGYCVSLGNMPHLTTHCSSISGQLYNWPTRASRYQPKLSSPTPSSKAAAGALPSPFSPTANSIAPPPDAAAFPGFFQIRACKMDLVGV